ncbi:hypothetical protein DICVIV_09792 [Dictyocaulus viviparus]|uniref:A to I editase domain-containing protein n=1 Tax=Dictyocaulus viviparus TaxID=29172 RepID=A0A0D8XPB1_DICVI|nr:hypothetical protein DICVIV_09792 [Dictyocaulus viviparus]
MSIYFSEDLPKDVKDLIMHTRKNPISLFLEMYAQLFKTTPEIIFEIVPGETKNSFLFVTRVRIGDTLVKGSPHRNKKVSKLDCFVKGIKVLCERYSIAVTNFAHDLQFKKNTTFFELLHLHTYSKLYSLSQLFPEVIGTEKVISSIFLITKKDNVSNAEIVSLATGSKGLRGDMLSLCGCSVNDCHAEVITRRGLLRFLYAQVLLYIQDPSKSIFLKNPETEKLTLRKGLSFHMFVNTVPCGNARVNSLIDYTHGNKNDLSTNDLLRFKIESGMGTVLGRIPETLGPQTVDGIIGGERLRTMSCSDKIMRWNVLGVQGALLSLFVDPIYISSVTIADKHDKNRLERALYRRLEGFSPSAPYRVNKPYIAHCQVKLEFFFLCCCFMMLSASKQCESSTRETMRGSSISVNWNLADNSVEVVRTSSGRVLGANSEGVSRLSKKEFAKVFKRVCNDIGMPVPEGFTYENIKVHCEEYEETKHSLEIWLHDQKLGVWHSKPEEVSKFVV